MKKLIKYLIGLYQAYKMKKRIKKKLAELKKETHLFIKTSKVKFWNIYMYEFKRSK